MNIAPPPGKQRPQGGVLGDMYDMLEDLAARLGKLEARRARAQHARTAYLKVVPDPSADPPK